VPALAADPGVELVQPRRANVLKFIRENWVWIVAPIVVVALLLVSIAWLGGGDSSAPFVYNIF
jgi:hypothetical protein